MSYNNYNNYNNYNRYITIQPNKNDDTYDFYSNNGNFKGNFRREITREEINAAIDTFLPMASSIRIYLRGPIDNELIKF
jgi:hypothetical protein